MSRPALRLLREVSRSFYLSIRVLPAPMRVPVGLAYLVARASDTIADTAAVPVDRRQSLLLGFSGELKGGSARWRDDLSDFRNRQSHEGEKALIDHMDAVFAQVGALPDRQRIHVIEVASTIVGGQQLDIERMVDGGGRLANADMLEDYCHRVAGCVGLFWTRIGFETLGRHFSRSGQNELEVLGERFGRGLQLINILRDLPGDLDEGRCYLPVEPEPSRILEEATRWRDVARQRMADGLDYAGRMAGWRLRVAAGLPARIGAETLDRLDHADWATLSAGVKVARRTVRRCLWRSAWGKA